MARARVVNGPRHDFSVGDRVLISLAAGVWPEWLGALTNAAAHGIIEPSAYISSVFGGGS